MDINTKTSSVITKDANVSTQTQRNNKSDVSFLDEINKFANEVGETSEIVTNEHDETEINSEHKALINNTPEINSKHQIKPTINAGNNTNLIKQNKEKHTKPVLMQQVETNKDLNAEINNLITSKDNKISDKNTAQEIHFSKQETNNIIPATEESFANSNKPKFQKNENINPIKNSQNVITPKDTVEIQKSSIKVTAEKLINTTKVEAIEEKINTEIGNSLPIENIAVEAAAIASQTAAAIQNTTETIQKTDNIQTLIEANKQLADIALIADAKIANINITEKTATKDSIKVDYSTIQMSTEDAVFFADLVQDTEKTLQNVVADLQSEVEHKVQEASKNVKISATLMNAISEAAKTNQPMRIDFDKDISIIIKIDKDGAVNAKFIPGDKAVEEYLKQNISMLRQRFDEQELNYRDLSYSNRQKHNQENNRRNNKEKDHE